MEITPQNMQFLFTDFQRRYEDGFGARPVLWTEFAERVPSVTESNTYAWLADLPGFREWVGARIFHNIAARTYAVTNKDWEDSFAVSRNKIEDDQFGIYGRMAQLLGDAAARLWDDIAFDTLQAGNTTIGFDGQYFFDTDHPVDMDGAAAGTYSNSLSAMPLTVPNLLAVKAAMMAFKGESGRLLNVEPDTLLVPPQLAGDAFAAAQAPIYSAGGAVVPNPNTSNILGQVRVLVAPKLANQPTVYYLLSTGRIKPIIIQVRKEPQFVARTAPESDPVFHRKMFEYGADARGAGGFSLPFTAIRVSTV